MELVRRSSPVIMVILIGAVIGTAPLLKWYPALGIVALLALAVIGIAGNSVVIYGLLALIAFGSDGWLPGETPPFNIFEVQFAGLHLMEWVVYGLIAVYLLTKVFRRESLEIPRQNRLPVLLAGMLAAWLPVSALIGLAAGNETHEVFGYGEWRALFLALIVYVVIVCEQPERKRLTNYMWFFFGATAIRGLYASVKFLAGHGDYHPELGTIVVIDSNVLIVMMACILLVVALFALRVRLPYKKVTLPALCIGLIPMLYAIVESLRRNIWLGLVLGLLILALQLPRKRRWQLTILAVVGATLGAIGLLLLDERGTGIVAERIVGILYYLSNPDAIFSVTQNNTLPFHLYDLWDAWRYIVQAPILGHGFGSHYVRIMTAVAGVMGDEVIPNFVHNQYLHMWLKTGLAGLVLYVSWFCVVIARALRQARKMGSTLDGAVLIAVSSFLLASMVMQMWNATLMGQTKAPLIFVGVMILATCTTDASSEPGAGLGGTNNAQ